jgi:hypothetical protein
MAPTKTLGGRGRGLLPAVLALTAALAVLWLGLGQGAHPLTAQKLYHHLGSPLLRLLVYLGVGLLVGQAIESLGWATKLGGWVAPVLRWGHLSRESGAAFTGAFFSMLLANTMLWTFYQEDKISRRELTLAYLCNGGLPVYLLHLPTTFFIILPLTREAGLIYLGLTGTAALFRSAAVLLLARWRLPGAPAAAPAVASPAPPARKEKIVREIWRKFRRRFSRVVLYTLPIYVLIFLANDYGLFTWLRQAATSHAALDFLPMEAASVVAFSVAAEFTSGMAAAGAFLQTGALTVHQTVLALILGNIVSTPIRALRHQLPSHVGIFSPALGTKLLLLSQSLRLVSLVLVGAAYAWWM